VTTVFPDDNKKYLSTEPKESSTSFCRHSLRMRQMSRRTKPQPCPVESVGDSAGCSGCSLIFGLRWRRNFPTPMIVPPVPTPATNASGLMDVNDAVFSSKSEANGEQRRVADHVLQLFASRWGLEHRHISRRSMRVQLTQQSGDSCLAWRLMNRRSFESSIELIIALSSTLTANASRYCRVCHQALTLDFLAAIDAATISAIHQSILSVIDVP
jgi:hypothetical protein